MFHFFRQNAKCDSIFLTICEESFTFLDKMRKVFQFFFDKLRKVFQFFDTMRKDFSFFLTKCEKCFDFSTMWAKCFSFFDKMQKPSGSFFEQVF